MDKMNLYKCAQALSVKWKSFFGLGTEYVGYFKWEMAWALMGYYRYALPGEWADNASPTVILKSICDSCKQSSKVHTFSPANAHFFSASFLAGNGLVVS